MQWKTRSPARDERREASDSGRCHPNLILPASLRSSLTGLGSLVVTCLTLERVGYYLPSLAGLGSVEQLLRFFNRLQNGLAIFSRLHFRILQDDLPFLVDNERPA
jgi:hypothetical protein